MKTSRICKMIGFCVHNGGDGLGMIDDDVTCNDWVCAV